MIQSEFVTIQIMKLISLNSLTCFDRIPNTIHKYNNRMNHLKKHGFEPYHVNFNTPDGCSSIESTYNKLNIILRDTCKLVFGISIHATERMTQRGITDIMLGFTIQNGTVFHEGPQKSWDGEGRKTFTYDNMVIVTNFNQNRIVTVFWHINNWDLLGVEDRILYQQRARHDWMKRHKSINYYCS